MRLRFAGVVAGGVEVLARRRPRLEPLSSSISGESHAVDKNCLIILMCGIVH